MDSDKIALAAEMACLLEVNAEKPGNVTRRKDFDELCFEDFIISAAAVGAAFRRAAHVPVGETILSAVRATRRFVGVNTNLGIVLLLAPLTKAAGMDRSHELRPALGSVLKKLTVEDARLAYESIRLAKPAGMGTVGVLTGFDDYDALKNERPDAIIDSIAQLSEILVIRTDWNGENYP